jgi:hypothetical protein
MLAALAAIYLVTIFDDRTFHRLVAGMLGIAVGVVVYCITDMVLRR